MPTKLLKSAAAKVQKFPSNHNNAYYMPPTMLFITTNAVFTNRDNPPITTVVCSSMTHQIHPPLTTSLPTI